MRASFLFHQVSAIISLLASIYFLYISAIHWNKIPFYQYASLLFLLATSWGIQSVLYFCEEYFYDFEPISGRITIHTHPVSRK